MVDLHTRMRAAFASPHACRLLLQVRCLGSRFCTPGRHLCYKVAVIQGKVSRDLHVLPSCVKLYIQRA